MYPFLLDSPNSDLKQPFEEAAIYWLSVATRRLNGPYLLTAVQA